MKVITGLFLLLTVLSCAGNKTSFQNEEEMQAYINDPGNGYISSTETSDFKMEAKLIPAIKDDKVPQLTVQVRLNRLDGLSVLEYGKAGQAEVLEREGYLSFGILEDVYLENAGKLQPAVFHHYERNYGLKPSVDLFFRFNNFTPKEDVTFVYRDQLFNQGMFRIKFNKALFTSCHVQD